MMKIKMPVFCLLVFIVVSAFLFSSCGSTKEINYMQGSFDTAKLSQIQYNEPLIQKGDMLSIIMYSDNSAATALYNQPLTGSSGGAGGGSSGSGQSSGYLVDEYGNIQMQSIGLFHVEGMTKKQLSDSLVKYFLKNELLKNPYCVIHFLNYKFTMLGEIMRPGVFSIPADHINLFEALAMAGDLTIYGKRENVLIIRETAGKRQFARLDLTKPDVISSPYFQLQQNDLIVVEQTRKKAASNDATTARNISIAATVVSTIAIIINLLRL